MKVLFVHSFYDSRIPSGENKVVKQQVEALARHGAEVHLAARHTDDGGLLHPLSSAVSVSFGIGPSPLDAISRFEPDVVHVHNLFPNWGSSWLPHVAPRLIATLHNFRPICSAATLFRDGHGCTDCPTLGTSLPAVRHACYRDSRIATLPLAWRTRQGGSREPVLRHARKLVVLAERAARIYTDHGVPAERVEVIPNFASPAPVPAIASDSRPAWLYVGRLAPEKGILPLIEKWPTTERLRILGDGPLAAQVAARSGPQVESLGHLPHDQVLAEMSTARGLVFPSLWPEGLPTVYLEAMSMGLPVIALAGNTVADEVERTGTGIVLPNLQTLASAMTRIRDNADHYRNTCTAAFADDYSESTWIKRTMALYEEVANG
jgi:glycosyltransferase involved in cell wall biosynthesis